VSPIQIQGGPPVSSNMTRLVAERGRWRVADCEHVPLISNKTQYDIAFLTLFGYIYVEERARIGSLLVARCDGDDWVSSPSKLIP
jgi:hypothetical protein